MASTLDWKSSDDPRDIVHIVVQALVEGKLVVLPAETAYHVVASGLKPEAVRQLMDMGRGGLTCRPSLFLRAASEALDYAPELSKVASRLVNRGWPGPLVLELPVTAPTSLTHCLPAEVHQSLLLDGNFIAHRVAAHEAIRQAMRLMPGPLVAAPLCESKPGANMTPICQGDRVAAHCGAHVAAIVDDRTTHFGGLATAVRVDGNRCSVTTPGVLNGENLQRLGQLVVMLVCTGNTCRSPMAETLMRAGLKKRFTELFQNGNQPVFVTSAGLSAFPGGPASPEAITVMKSLGLSLLDHQSRAVTERGLRIADLVLTMTASHRSAIVDRFPDIADKVHLLSGSNEDLADPFGGSEAVYMACADQIQAYVARWISQFDASWFPDWVFSAEN